LLAAYRDLTTPEGWLTAELYRHRQIDHWHHRQPTSEERRLLL